MKKLYSLYEYIRDEKCITEDMSSTKRIINELMLANADTLKYCQKKMAEERNEVQEATVGNHFHENMTKREILVNELSQYMYWQIVLDVSQHVNYEDTKVFKNMRSIIEKIDVSQIGESQKVTLGEVIEHDLENMKKKEYLSEVV